LATTNAPSSSPRKVRTLAISQLPPTFILTWLPTWPDMATDGSLRQAREKFLGVHADLRARSGDLEHLADDRRGPLGTGLGAGLRSFSSLKLDSARRNCAGSVGRSWVPHSC
jgi:hypothetical protein